MLPKKRKEMRSQGFLGSWLHASLHLWSGPPELQLGQLMSDATALRQRRWKVQIPRMRHKSAHQPTSWHHSDGCGCAASGQHKCLSSHGIHAKWPQIMIHDGRNFTSTLLRPPWNGRKIVETWINPILCSAQDILVPTSLCLRRAPEALNASAGKPHTK